MSYLKKHKLDILFLQETHMTSVDQIYSFKKSFSIPSWFGLSPMEGRGTAILINPLLKFKFLNFQTDPEGRTLILDTQIEDVNFSLVNIYASCIDNERRNFFTS